MKHPAHTSHRRPKNDTPSSAPVEKIFGLPKRATVETPSGVLHVAYASEETLAAFKAAWLRKA